MCFYVRNNKESKTLWIAKQDITCYKVLMDNMISPYQKFKYKLDKLIRRKISKLYDEDISRSKFFPLYKNDKAFRIEKGLHSYSSFLAAKVGVWPREHIYKAIIPKGSEFYYDNVEKQYVSNQLIIKKLIK